MASNNPANPSVKEQREAKRAAKVAVLKKQQARDKRNRRLGIGGAILGGVVVLALIAFVIWSNYKPTVDPDDIAISGVETFDDLPNTHVTTAVDYEATYGATPPAGGNHAGAWLNCGVYSEEQQNENAVHSLEHGAVWVTYDPEALSESEVETLRDAMPSTYTILSPYPGLPAPVVASGWGVQVQLDGVDDPRLADFITKYKESPDGPEYGASCTGAIDGPGKIA